MLACFGFYCFSPIIEWVKSPGETVLMYDEDPKHSKVESDGCKALAKLSNYKIEDNAVVKFTQKQAAISMDPKSSLHRHGKTTSLIA